LPRGKTCSGGDDDGDDGGGENNDAAAADPTPLPLSLLMISWSVKVYVLPGVPRNVNGVSSPAFTIALPDWIVPGMCNGSPLAVKALTDSLDVGWDGDGDGGVGDGLGSLFLKKAVNSMAGTDLKSLTCLTLSLLLLLLTLLILLLLSPDIHLTNANWRVSPTLTT
jgi:hypothetical protein